jgi:GTP-binding protein
MKKIAIIGRPNVGKSSLFNRLLGARDAIISDVAGTTRDVKKRVIKTNKGHIELWDTGGIEDRDELFDRVKEKSMKSAGEADVLLFIVDGKEPPREDEKRLFYELAKLDKPMALVVNKTDNDKEEQNGWEFMSFGAKDYFFVSVSHNRNMTKLIFWIEQFIDEDDSLVDYSVDEEESLEDFLDDEDEEFEETSASDDEIRVAIIGRPNVGKSSLLNAIIGENRSIVSPVAGTTIDPVDESYEYEGRRITFIDTAGIRKRSKIIGIEKWALDRSEKVLDRANIAILTLDASDDLVEQDEKVAGFIDKHKCAVIIVLNKWDVITRDSEEILAEVKRKFRFLEFAPIVTASALSGKRVPKILEHIVRIYENYAQKIPTKKLNDVIKSATQKHALASDHGRIPKIKFAVQYGSKPPKISLVMNFPSIHFSYKRYLINQLRENFDFEGTPILITAKRRGDRDPSEDGDDE